VIQRPRRKKLGLPTSYYGFGKNRHREKRDLSFHERVVYGERISKEGRVERKKKGNFSKYLKQSLEVYEKTTIGEESPLAR